MGLRTYQQKRDFDKTPEPRGSSQPSADGRSFVVQKHAARRLHHDFRLELDGVLLSWAVPKGPPNRAGGRVLAVRTEDHPLEYGAFEGVIPKGEYGGGTVMLWDRGTWSPLGDAQRGLRDGKLDFELDGERLRGRWSLLRLPRRDGEARENWLMIKRTDRRDDARAVDATTDRSVASGRTMQQIADARQRTWTQAGEVAHEQTSVAVEPLRASELPHARPAALPKRLEPQLATLVERPPDGDEWLHEIKFDGYRLLAFRDGASVRLVTRSGQDWTDRFPRIVTAVRELPLQRCALDGEVVVLDRNGVSNFQALQNSLDRGEAHRHVYFVFDLLHCDDHDLAAVPLHARKQLLASFFAGDEQSTLRYSSHVTGSGPAFHREACQHGLEGIVSKRADSRYEARRSRGWLKTKCLSWQEFVVGGFTAERGRRSHLGALLLGVHEADGLRYVGKVGTGFSEASLQEMKARLEPLAVASAPFADAPRGALVRGVTWVQPKCVVEVAFIGWTDGGRLRHPSFRGVRDDKPAAEVRREQPQSPRSEPARKAPPQRGNATGNATKRARQQQSHAPAAAATASATTTTTTVAGIRLSNPDRVLFPEVSITKAELAGYVEAVAEHLLPHVVDRPLSVVRCPQGRGAKCFYQKHHTDGLPASVRRFPVDENGERADYLGVVDLAGVVALVQFGALELHPWGCRRDRLDRPDRIVFDLDPAPDVEFARVVAAAHRLHELLGALGLEGFVRTTGGKGLHVVVPIERRSDWPEVKQFAHDLSQVLAKERPDEFVLVATKARRAGRIFVDYLRNGRGSTAIASYSARARPGAPVAMPLAWQDVREDLDPAAFTVRTVPPVLAERGDAWRGFATLRQTLSASMRRAVRELAP